MKDAKVYFEDMDRITQEVIIDLFVSILENKIRKGEIGKDRGHEKSDEQGDASHSKRGKSQRKKCEHP